MTFKHAYIYPNNVRPEQNGYCILFKISFKVVRKGSVDNEQWPRWQFGDIQQASNWINV